MPAPWLQRHLGVTNLSHEVFAVHPAPHNLCVYHQADLSSARPSWLHTVGIRLELRAAAANAASHGALVLPTYLFEIVQAMLVTVGDVEGVEVLQRTSLVW